MVASDPDFDDYDMDDELEFPLPLAGDGDGEELDEEEGEVEDEEDLELDFGASGTGIESLAELELDDYGETDAESEGGSTMTWAERRQKKLEGGMKKTRKSWEEKYEDDPLRSESPTMDLDLTAYVPYDKFFVLTGEISSTDMLQKRQEAWTHHLQWVRRNTLSPFEEKSVHIEWDYTTLSKDSMGPTGQVLGIRGNSSADIERILESEPLRANGGIQKWRIFEYHPVVHDNATCIFKDPFIFIGKQKSKPPKSLEQEQLDYHTHSNYRVASMGELTSVDKKGAEDEFLIVFNSKTVKGAEKYIREDPLIKSGALALDPALVRPINIQDTDGLNHLMARSFTEARELNQVRGSSSAAVVVYFLIPTLTDLPLPFLYFSPKIHFMDPLDLLEIEVPTLRNLPQHSQENERVLTMLKAETSNRVPKYVRHNWVERFGSVDLLRQSELHQEGVYESQKVRLPISDTVSRDDGVAVESEEGAFSGGGGDE
jgi:hypothetical protein